MGMNKYENGKIMSNDCVGENVYKMVVEGKFEGKPGQFYMVRNWELDPILSRPLGVCDLTENSITFLYMVVGRGTRCFSNMKVGEEISVFGPLGNGFTLGDEKRVAIVSGSAGIAPMLLLAKSLNCEVDLYAGFRDEAFFVDEFEAHVDNVYISSDNGKVGYHGNVVQLIKETGKEYDMVYACGPNPMLRALASELPKDKLQMSMESHMACGFGVCLGCAIETVEGNKRVCHDGPVFYAKEVVFDA